VVHPDVTVDLLQRVRLPGYMCARLTTFRNHTFDLSDLPTAVSSKCVPVPSQLAEMDAKEAGEFIPDAPVLLDPIDITVDTIIEPLTLSTINDDFINLMITRGGQSPD
jgi:hypothetical protein